MLSHFLYLSQRLLGPPTLVSASPVYPSDPALCETHISATLDCDGVPVSVLGSSGGAGPDRVEMTIWGSRCSHRLHDWFDLQSSDGAAWQQEFAQVEDSRGEAFGFQLDNVAAWVEGRDHILPSARDALAVQELVEAMLAGKNLG